MKVCMSVATSYNIDRLLQEWRINGFVVFEDFIPIDKIDRILEAWKPIRAEGVKRQGKHPVRGYHRYNVRVPFLFPFVDEEIFEHPDLVEFLGRILGKDYAWSHFDSNIPFPGSDYQSWHRDSQLLFPGIKLPAFDVGVKFPLVDTNEENGSFEVIPCTQYVADEDLQNDLDSILGGDECHSGFHPIRLNLKRGSVWVQDGRAYHRGTPNRSEHPRDELCMAFCRPWLFNQWQHEYTEKHFPRELWESLSPHSKEVLRWQRVKDV